MEVDCFSMFSSRKFLKKSKWAPTIPSLDQFEDTSGLGGQVKLGTVGPTVNIRKTKI